MHLAQGHQDILGLEVDGQLTAAAKAPVAPGTLEHMGERQEAHDDILVREIHDFVVGRDGGRVHTVGQRDAL